MKKAPLLLLAITGLGGFTLGYLTGQSSKATNTGDTTSSPSTASHDTHASSSSDPSATNTKSKPRTANTDSVPTPEKNFSRRIVAMMSKGDLVVNGVSINGDTLMPEEKVKEFLDLTDDQFETLKQIGRDQLQQRQQHEQATLKMVKSTADEIVFDLPADPAFAARQKESYIEALRKELGPDVAAVLQSSAGAACDGFLHPRHVRYTLTPRKDSIPENMPPQLRRTFEAMYNFTTSVNQNEDGTYMTDERGVTLLGGQSSSGSISLYDPKPDAWQPHFHYLLKQPQSE
ncbi:hypothetical protein [Luteolibacter soli]|uniref:Uncharacterized protein n=1 Tax=Luteolibacter soli TaxID=3135280 RepID=A0ABU9AXK4_9BACT